jgi:hypothetical protein
MNKEQRGKVVATIANEQIIAKRSSLFKKEKH